MKHCLTIILLTLSLAVFGQETPRSPFKVIAPSGLKMRAETSATAKVVTFVPKDSIVQVNPTRLKNENFEGINGSWVSVHYKGNEGFMFDGFLEAVIPEMSSKSPDTLVHEVENSSIASDTIFENNDEPLWTWNRTHRDSIPSKGSLEPNQINELAKAIRMSPVATDSIISVLYEQPTRGAQDSIIAWLMAGRPNTASTSKKEVLVSVEESKAVKELKPEVPSTDVENQNKEAPVEKIPSIQFKLLTESFNYCGDISEIDPGKIWYAMYPSKLGFQLKPVELQVMMSKVKISQKLEFDIRTNLIEGAYFIFSSSKLLDTTKMHYWLPEQLPNLINTPLLPGISGDLPPFGEGVHQGNVLVYATGNVVDVGPCNSIENYQLKINAQAPGREIKQTLNGLFSTFGDCNIPELYWFGDLNEDQYTDLIFVSPGKDQNVFTLLLSDINLPSGLYYVGSEWILSTCK